MAIEQADLEQIVEAVTEILRARMEEVYGVIEQLREEFRETVTVMDGNDHAIIAELQKMKGVTPAEVLKEAGESWERFVTAECKRLGLTVLRPKGTGD